MLCVMAVVDSADAWQHPARAGLAQKMHKAATTATSCRDIFLQFTATPGWFIIEGMRGPNRPVVKLFFLKRSGVDSCVFLIFTTRVGLKPRLNGVKLIRFEQYRKF
jgi:hypothetical protein